MDIWEILHIEPTTDRKAIRRAYAARTRVVHPEEKPEEFKMLHTAYQVALKYAEFALKSKADFAKASTVEASSAQTSSEQESAEHGELLSFFTENQEKQKQRIAAFEEYWRELKNISDDPKGYEWWQEYLASDDFQFIRWNTQILHLLIEGIDDKFFYGTNEVKMLFWNAYGFRANDEDNYQGDQQALWRCLYPAYDYYEKVFLAKEWDRRSRRNFLIIAAVAFVVLLIVGIRVLIYSRGKMENERQQIEMYMTERYPGTDFSEPERNRQQGTSGVAYNLYSSDHPDLLITAKVEYPYQDNGRSCVVTEEDYGLQLMEYYAAQYGLSCGRIEYMEEENNSRDTSIYSVLFYSDIGEIDAFCETVAKMFDEQEELQWIPSVGIGAEDILYPEVLLQGGVTGFLFDGPQFYDLRTIDGNELARRLEEVYIIYMFQYEPWNLSMQQFREWGPAYQELCWQWNDYRGLWYDLTDLSTGELMCTIYVSTYMHPDYRHSVPAYEESVTVGNAYDFLLIQGVDVTVNEDGSGFTAEINGQTETFGSEPEVRVDKLGSLPEEMQNSFLILQ